MRKVGWICGACALVICGCGGGGGAANGEISGVVFDSNGNVVRNAYVFLNSDLTNSVHSNSNGTYVLKNVSPGQQLVVVNATQDGVKYAGENVATVDSSQRAKSVNITVANVNDLASIKGQVTDRSGLAVQGARVFAVASALTSNIAVTDAQGNYRMDDLLAGVQYSVEANALTTDSDTTTVTLNPGDVQTENFLLPDATNPALPAPQNLAATSWTSPPVGRAPGSGLAYEQLKRLVDPKRAREYKAQSRETTTENEVEIDLSWDPVTSNSLLGFGIYRGPGTGTTSLAAIDYERDPYALYYADNDDRLIQNQTFTYEITSLNTDYPSTGQSESPKSNAASATTLNNLTVDATSAGPTFHWESGSGATQFIVYVFDRYPSLGVTQIWDNSASPATGLSVAYNGPQLRAGKTYYYLVLGTANSQTSHTIGPVGSFVAN